jgi:threonine/homoserine/homoserine lactone efflux protein
MMNSVFVSLVTFVGAATLLTITPGLDTALVLRTAIVGNAQRAACAGLGIALGCLCWATLVALGLGALLAASQLAYTAVCWAGAAYLLYVGYGLLRHPRTSFSTEERVGGDSAFGAFGRGALTKLHNPKVGVFYVSFLPQFVPHGFRVASFVVLLGAIHSLLGLIWFACLIMATRPISRFLRRPRTVMLCDRITGAVFVSFGLKLVSDSRALAEWTAP